MTRFWVTFKENGNEYTGSLEVDCDEIAWSKDNECVFFADGVRIQIDEEIIDIVDADKRRVTNIK